VDYSFCCCVQANSNLWQAMQRNSGADWYISGSQPSRAPFSIRLITLSTRKTLTAVNVIPQNWKPGATYRSIVNFD